MAALRNLTLASSYLERATHEWSLQFQPDVRHAELHSIWLTVLIFRKLRHRILLVNLSANYSNPNYMAAYAPGFAPQ